MSKAAPDKFHWSGRHNKCICVQDRAKIHKSQACQIVLIFNTVYVIMNWAIIDSGPLFVIPCLTPSHYPNKYWLMVNKVWWLCLVPTSTTRFASDVGYRMAKIEYSYTRKIFLWTMASNSLTENEELGFPSKTLKTIFGLNALVSF